MTIKIFGLNKMRGFKALNQVTISNPYEIIDDITKKTVSFYGIYETLHEKVGRLLYKNLIESLSPEAVTFKKCDFEKHLWQLDITNNNQSLAYTILYLMENSSNVLHPFGLLGLQNTSWIGMRDSQALSRITKSFLRKNNVILPKKKEFSFRELETVETQNTFGDILSEEEDEDDASLFDISECEDHPEILERMKQKK